MSNDRTGEQRLEARIDKIAGDFGDNPIKSTLRFCSILTGIFLFVMALSWGCGWIGNSTGLVSFENFEEQHTQLHQDWESMQAVQANHCAALDVLESAIERGAPESTISQRESQALAHENNYRRIQADYDRRRANFFETVDGFVAPAELPETAPELQACN